MSATEIRRPLEDMITELVDGLSVLPTLHGDHRSATPLMVTRVELALPVETRVVGGPQGPVVHADMPTLRTRTAFDLPLSRFVLRLATMPTEVAP